MPLLLCAHLRKRVFVYRNDMASVMAECLVVSMGNRCDAEAGVGNNISHGTQLHSRTEKEAETAKNNVEILGRLYAVYSRLAAT